MPCHAYNELSASIGFNVKKSDTRHPCQSNQRRESPFYPLDPQWASNSARFCRFCLALVDEIDATVQHVVANEFRKFLDVAILKQVRQGDRFSSDA